MWPVSSPLEPGFKLFEVKPRMAGLSSVSAGNVIVAGEIAVSIQEKNGTFQLSLDVPASAACLVHIPEEYQ